MNDVSFERKHTITYSLFPVRIEVVITVDFEWTTPDLKPWQENHDIVLLFLLLLTITKPSTNQSLLETHVMHQLDSFYSTWYVHCTCWHQNSYVSNCVLYHHHTVYYTRMCTTFWLINQGKQDLFNNSTDNIQPFQHYKIVLQFQIFRSSSLMYQLWKPFQKHLN